MEKLPVDFTFSFWTIFIEDFSDKYKTYNYDLINAFGRIFVQAKRIGGSGTSHQIIMNIVENSVGLPKTFTNNVANLIPN